MLKISDILKSISFTKSIFIFSVLYLSLSGCQKGLDYAISDVSAHGGNDPDTTGNSNNTGNSSDTTGYYMMFKENGVQREINGLNYAIFMNDSVHNIYSVQIYMQNSFESSNSPVNNLEFTLWNDAAIATDTEYSDQYLNSIGHTQAMISYFDENGDTYLSESVSPADIKIKLLEITSDYISGIFEGKVQSASGTVLNITEGTFKVIHR